MAERRMFAKSIIDSDAFLDMPLSAQALYFHLSMRADDEGFVGNPKRIRAMIGASEDDMKLLLIKRFLLAFESGVVVIKHWKIHNYIQSDRSKQTTYIEEKSTLGLDGKKAYIYKTDTECIQNGYNLDTQVSIGKVSIVEDSREEVKEDIVSMYVGTKESACAHVKSYEEIMNDCCVEEEVRPMLWEFIKHCQANGHTLINSKLTSIILALDFAYGNSPHEKIASLRKAINSGHYDVLENNKS